MIGYPNRRTTCPSWPPKRKNNYARLCNANLFERFADRLGLSEGQSRGPRPTADLRERNDHSERYHDCVRLRRLNADATAYLHVQAVHYLLRNGEQQDS
jgi:hypothetical protein